MNGRLNVNVAFNRPTLAVSEWSDHFGPYSASNAVDGNRDGDALKPQHSCFASGRANEPWWSLDLANAPAVMSCGWEGNRGSNGPG